MALPVATLHAPPPLHRENWVTPKKPQGMPGSAVPMAAQVRFAARVHQSPCVMLQPWSLVHASPAAPPMAHVPCAVIVAP